MARPRTGRAQQSKRAQGQAAAARCCLVPWCPGGPVCRDRSWPWGARDGVQGHTTPEQALEVRATKRPTIPAPSHLLDKVVKRHHSSTNIVTLKLSNLFVVNEHTDGRQYCTNETQTPNQFAHHSDSGWRSGIAQEKKTF